MIRLYLSKNKIFFNEMLEINFNKDILFNILNRIPLKKNEITFHYLHYKAVDHVLTRQEDMSHFFEREYLTQLRPERNNVCIHMHRK